VRRTYFDEEKNKLSRINYQRGKKRDFHHKNYYKIYII